MKAKLIVRSFVSLMCLATLGMTVTTAHAAVTGETSATTTRKVKETPPAESAKPVVKLTNLRKFMYVGQYNRFKATINKDSGLKIAKYRVSSSNPKVLKVSNGLLTRGMKLGVARVTVKMTLSNKQIVTQRFSVRVVAPVMSTAKASGYRIVKSSANVWTKPYYKAQQNKHADASKNVQGYMVKLSQKATTVDNKVYYQVALPGSGQKVGWVPASGLKPAGQYWRNATGGKTINVKKTKNLNVEVSVAKQRVYLKSGNKIVYTMLCSTGAYATPTVLGHFKLSSGGSYFWGGNGGAKYWRAFAPGGYYFHSIPTTSANGAYGTQYGNQLGHRASHGCIRLSVADSIWFYKNMPNGTKVYVH
ncbi:L,D-transpeptidase [Periweissella cryptocerci]|uniref:L,D-transpeptidase n=1 Tax=Periweissella cryptocerci TaxID=2506420 RepID=A0A4V1AIK4_9LACO|nr:L,D-transpeptidase [Periweissella cryptocerci]QBO35815.1 L,D-transpeptidase [Periweissella cryptocerci]